MKLSIITINYNNAAGLKKTLDSVAIQTYTNFEHIIVDGNSTDESVEIIRTYVDEPILNPSLKGGTSSSTDNLPSHQEREGDRLVYWLSEPDSGIYNAMNKGIEIVLGKRIINTFNRSELIENKNKDIKFAHGEYLLFLNSGDFLVAPTVLEQVFAQNHDVDIINARCRVSDYGKVIWTSPYLPKVTLKDLYFVGLPHQSTFIRCTLFDKYGMYREDFRYNSDMDFWYKSIAIGDATTYGVDLVTTDYNLDGTSTINAKTETYKKEVHEILSQGFLPKVLLDYELWKEERDVYSRYSWIEQHRGLQKLLLIYHKVNKRLRKVRKI